MDSKALIAQVDLEIARLEQARNILADPLLPTAISKTRAKKYRMSVEGRARIVAAQRKRWAAQEKAAK